MRVRRLKPGERVPATPPRRYPRSDRDAVVLRWRVGPGEFVETGEHRVIDGTVIPVAGNGKTVPIPGRDVLAAAVASGASIASLAERFGASPAYLGRLIRRYGIARERLRPGPKPRSMS